MPECSGQLKELPPLAQSANISTPNASHVAEGPHGTGIVDGQLPSSQVAAVSSEALGHNSLPMEVAPASQAAVHNNALPQVILDEAWEGAQAVGCPLPISNRPAEAAQGLQGVTAMARLPPREVIQLSGAEQTRGMLSQPFSRAAGPSSMELPMTHHAAATAAQQRAAFGINTQTGASAIRPPPSSQAAGTSAARKRPREDGVNVRLSVGAPPQSHAAQPGVAAHTANKRPRTESAGQSPVIMVSRGQAGQPQQSLRRYTRREKNEEGLDVSKDACAGLPPWMHGPSAVPQHMQQRIEVQEEAWGLRMPLPLWRPECPLGWFPL